MRYIAANLPLMLALFMISVIGLSPAQAAKSIQVAFGESLEPYVIRRENRGIELDIVRQAFLASGYPITPTYTSQPRLPMMLENPNIEAIATTQAQPTLHAYFSDEYINYQNVAITLRNRHIHIDSIYSLAQYKILAFSNAKKYLGKEFDAMARKNLNYAETADQQNQSRLLSRGFIDVVISDWNIYQWMAKQQENLFKEPIPEVEAYHFFPATPYRLACRTIKICHAFNNGLKTIIKNGTYQKIYDQYK